MLNLKLIHYLTISVLLYNSKINSAHKIVELSETQINSINDIKLSLEKLQKNVEDIKDYLNSNNKKDLDIIHEYESNSAKDFECFDSCRPTYKLPEDCENAMSSFAKPNGIYRLYIRKSGLKPFYAYCERQNNSIWTVIQRRFNGYLRLEDLNWADYRNGFGDLNEDFWWGLERLHQITKYGKHELYIYLEDENCEGYFARYDNFAIANETQKYKLTIGNYSGNAGNGLEYHNGLKFSTADNRNDYNHYQNTTNHNDYNCQDETCVKDIRAGWWYGPLHHSNLNGDFHIRGRRKFQGVKWFPGDMKIKYTQMMIRKL